MQDPAYAEVGRRQEEMLFEQHAKESALRDKAKDLRTRAQSKANEVLAISRGPTQFDQFARNRAAQLGAEARELEVQSRAVLNIELPEVQRRTAQIASGNCGELITLAQSIAHRIQQARSDERRRLSNEYAKARDAFDSHIAKIANKKTLELAQALEDARRAAKETRDPTVEALLMTNETPVAA